MRKNKTAHLHNYLWLKILYLSLDSETEICMQTIQFIKEVKIQQHFHGYYLVISTISWKIFLASISFYASFVFLLLKISFFLIVYILNIASPPAPSSFSSPCLQFRFTPFCLSLKKNWLLRDNTLLYLTIF